MTEREKAADHLKVIRSLMERATVYRTLSWPTALFGGTLAVLLSVVIYLRERAAINEGETEKMISEWGWVICWLVALVVTCSFNTGLIFRQSKRDNRPLFSPGLKMALRAFLPPMLVGGVIGCALTLSITAAVGASIWVTCYGLALLATRGLAPKSIHRLGWAFLAGGLASFVFAWSDGAHPLPLLGAPPHMESPMFEASLIMGIAFGGFHLLYGLVVMKRGKRENDEEAATGE